MPSQPAVVEREVGGKPHFQNKGDFNRDQNKDFLKKPLPGVGVPAASSETGGIVFGKPKPTFKKSEQVGKKEDFPELGMDDGKKVAKATTGGSIGQMSAPAKGARTANTFEPLQT